MSSCSRNSASSRGCPKPSCVNWWITECSRRSTRTRSVGHSARTGWSSRAARAACARTATATRRRWRWWPRCSSAPALSKRSCATCAPGSPAAAPNSADSGHEEARAMSRLRRRVGDAPSARNALVGRKRHVVLDVVYQQIESALRVRLDQLELREKVLERLDIVAVLDLVEAVRGFPIAAVL